MSQILCSKCHKKYFMSEQICPFCGSSEKQIYDKELEGEIMDETKSDEDYFDDEGEENDELDETFDSGD